MVIEARCVGCGKRYRLKGDPNAMDFLSLPCPQCGGMLELGGEEAVFQGEFLLEKPLALVFWEREEDKSPFLKVLMGLGYEVRTLKRASLLAHWLRFHTPSLLVLVAEEGKIRPFVEVLNRLSMPERRQIFVVWVSDKVKTLDPRPAFLKSLQMVVSLEDLNRFPDLLERGQKIWQDFYQPFLKTQEQLEKEF